jgi:hypothetical protein
MTKLIWLSFDLGVKGDYEGLFAWLDSHQARECGDNLAVFHYEFKKNLLVELKKDINKAVEIDRRSRCYVIYLDAEASKMKGRFIFGKRRNAPWTGYGSSTLEEEDDA